MVPVTQIYKKIRLWTLELFQKLLMQLATITVTLSTERINFTKKLFLTLFNFSLTEWESVHFQMAETILGIFVIRQEGADPWWRPCGCRNNFLSSLRNIPLAIAAFFGLVYALNIDYPPDLKYTFENLQKIIMEMEENRLSI